MVSDVSTAPAKPLQRHVLLQSTRVDEVRAGVADAFCPHGLYPTTPGADLDARFASVRMGAIGLHHLEYGAEVRIVPRRLDSFFLVQIPLAGRALIQSGRERVHSDATTASVPDPDAPLDMTWGADNPQLIVWLDRCAMEAQLHRMLGRAPEKRLRFATGMDLTTPEAQSWLGVVRLLLADLDGAALATAHPACRAQMESAVMTQLLMAHRHTASEALRAPTPLILSKSVRRAAALMEEHSSETLTVADVAEAIGVSEWALQEGFRRHLGTTPRGYLLGVRLNRAHQRLELGDPGSTSVAEVASACGFTHLGRFAAAYRQRFGVSPSTTLRG